MVFVLAILALAGNLQAGSTAEESQFISNPRQLIYDGKRSGEGYFSRDGKKIILQSEREEGNPFYQIYLLDLETGDTSRISPGIGKTTCGFLRPGHAEAIFSSTHLDPKAEEKQRAEFEFRASGKLRRYAWDYDDSMDIFAAPLDGGQPRRLTDAPGYDAEGSYSPDGKQIVFCSLRDAFPLENLRELATTPNPPRRGLLFALWSGEEIGILGSAAFLANPPVPVDKIAAYVNFDMVGRLRGNRLILQGAGSSGVWRKLIEKRNVVAGFDLSVQDDPYLPTDVTSFYQRKIPVLNFFTGAHEDYHRPTDTAAKIDYPGLERIGRFARQIVLDLATLPKRPEYASVERSSP